MHMETDEHARDLEESCHVDALCSLLSGVSGLLTTLLFSLLRMF